MNNDLISRESVIKIYEEYVGIIDKLSGGTERGDINMLETCIDRLKEAPAVDAEVVRHGYWIAVGWDDESVTPAKFRRAGYKCSACDIGTAVKSPRCPRCGAKMDGGKKNG